MGYVEFDIVYWKDEVGGEIGRIHRKMDEYAYKIVGIGEWRALISAEDVKIKAKSPIIIKINKVEFPPNSIGLMLARMRHALGAVIELLHSGEPKYVEKVRYADQVLFLPIFDGEIKKGELLGVVNIFYIKPVKKSKIEHVFEKLEKMLSMDIDSLIESKDWPYLFK
ncbi:MAG: DUF22 domain-containing protein [Archaeoglobaceae archaeon]|nr:DUF22 domain-containing protein [Archaeoglobaceae archaeon]